MVWDWRVSRAGPMPFCWPSCSLLFLSSTIFHFSSFPIVDLWQCCVCCTRSGVTRSTHFVALYLCLMCRSGLHAVLWSHIIVLCTAPLQNLAVPQDFNSSLSISMERSGWPRIWWCGIGGFQEQVRCLFVGIVALSFFVFNYSLSLLFLYRLVVWRWGLRTDRVSISLSRPCIANLF